MTVIRFLAVELGLTVRTLALAAAALIIFGAAMALDADALYGLAVATATLAGATWQRLHLCDTCHERLDEPR